MSPRRRWPRDEALARQRLGGEVREVPAVADLRALAPETRVFCSVAGALSGDLIRADDLARAADEIAADGGDLFLAAASAVARHAHPLVHTFGVDSRVDRQNGELHTLDSRVEPARFYVRAP